MNDQSPEYGLVSKVLVPYLQKHWDEIDLPEPRSGFRDKRLTRDEIVLALARAVETRDYAASFVLSEVLIRYDKICQAHPDGYWHGEESQLGISEDDLGAYVDASRGHLARLLDDSNRDSPS